MPIQLIGELVDVVGGLLVVNEDINLVAQYQVGCHINGPMAHCRSGSHKHQHIVPEISKPKLKVNPCMMTKHRLSYQCCSDHFHQNIPLNYRIRPSAYQHLQGCACKVCETYRLTVKWQKCPKANGHCDTAFFFISVCDITMAQLY